MRAELFDAGTVLQKEPEQPTPGMDSAYYKEIDMEYQWPGEIQGDINERLAGTPTRVNLRPWPEPFPNRCWVDWTSRYEGADGGFKIDTTRYGMMFDDYSLVPAPTAQIPEDADYEPTIYRDDERLQDAKTVDEISAENDHPTVWLRERLGNELGGKRGPFCDLKQPTVMVQNFHVGDEFRAVVNYSPIFAPFDGRHPEWYDVIRSDGTQVTEDKERWMSFRQDGLHRVYLRPANWRWAVRVYANYIYASWFEMFNTREVFTHAYFNRPPVYPTRHDLIHTSQYTVWEYLNVEWSYDSGVSDGFVASRGASRLRSQIIDAQWWTMSEVYIFNGNDPATITMWLWPPEQGDIVLGIGRVDGVTGEEEVLWMVQNRDLTDEYQRTVIGSYIVPEFVVGI